MASQALQVAGEAGMKSSAALKDVDLNSTGGQSSARKQLFAKVGNKSDSGGDGGELNPAEPIRNSAVAGASAVVKKKGEEAAVC